MLLDEEVTAAGKFRANVRVTPTVKGIFAFEEEEEADAFERGIEEAAGVSFTRAGVMPFLEHGVAPAFILRGELRSGKFGGSWGI